MFAHFSAHVRRAREFDVFFCDICTIRFNFQRDLENHQQSLAHLRSEEQQEAARRNREDNQANADRNLMAEVARLKAVRDDLEAKMADLQAKKMFCMLNHHDPPV